jgi:hypothetical protein
MHNYLKFVARPSYGYRFVVFLILNLKEVIIIYRRGTEPADEYTFFMERGIKIMN